MDQDSIIKWLRAAEYSLRQHGVASAALFGSAARGDAGPQSDIDIAVRPAPGRTFGTAGLLGLYGFFSDLFGEDRRIDVIVLPARNPELDAAIEKEGVIAFA